MRKGYKKMNIIIKKVYIVYIIYIFNIIFNITFKFFNLKTKTILVVQILLR